MARRWGGVRLAAAVVVVGLAVAATAAVQPVPGGTFLDLANTAPHAEVVGSRRQLLGSKPYTFTARGKQFSACAPSATKFDNGRRLCIVSGNVVPGSATVTLQGWTDNKLKSAKGVITISGVDKGGKERWRWTLQANPASANQYGNWSPCSGNASDNNCFSNPAPFRVVAQAVHLTASVNMVFEFSSPT